MTVTTVSSRDFNQDVSQAKRAAALGPVVITGRPAYVLMCHEAYRRLVGGSTGIRQLLDQADPEAEAFDFDPPRLGSGLFRASDLA